MILILTPGVIIKSGIFCLDQIKNTKKSIGTSNYINIRAGDAYEDIITKVFPLQIHIGGSLGNVGVNISKFQDGISPGLVTVFFESKETLNGWKNQLTKATGSYIVRDYYETREKEANDDLAAAKVSSNLLMNHICQQTRIKKIFKNVVSKDPSVIDEQIRLLYLAEPWDKNCERYNLPQMGRNGSLVVLG